MTGPTAPDRLLSVLAAFDHEHPALCLTDISRMGRAEFDHRPPAGGRAHRMGRPGA